MKPIVYDSVNPKSWAFIVCFSVFAQCWKINQVQALAASKTQEDNVENKVRKLLSKDKKSFAEMDRKFLEHTADSIFKRSLHNPENYWHKSKQKRHYRNAKHLPQRRNHHHHNRKMFYVDKNRSNRNYRRHRRHRRYRTRQLRTFHNQEKYTTNEPRYNHFKPNHFKPLKHHTRNRLFRMPLKRNEYRRKYKDKSRRIAKFAKRLLFSRERSPYVMKGRVPKRYYRVKSRTFMRRKSGKLSHRVAQIEPKSKERSFISHYHRGKSRGIGHRYKYEDFFKRKKAVWKSGKIRHINRERNYKYKGRQHNFESGMKNTRSKMNRQSQLEMNSKRIINRHKNKPASTHERSMKRGKSMKEFTLKKIRGLKMKTKHRSAETIHLQNIARHSTFQGRKHGNFLKVGKARKRIPSKNNYFHRIHRHQSRRKKNQILGFGSKRRIEIRRGEKHRSSVNIQGNMNKHLSKIIHGSLKKNAVGIHIKQRLPETQGKGGTDVKSTQNVVGSPDCSIYRKKLQKLVTKVNKSLRKASILAKIIGKQFGVDQKTIDKILEKEERNISSSFFTML